MNSWTQLISDTVQMGGSLIFILDQESPLQRSCLEVVNLKLAGKVPMGLRSEADFLTGRFHNRAEDLVIFFDNQVALTQSMNPFVQGQRLWLKSIDEKKTAIVDFVWENFSLSGWTAVVDKLSTNWDQLNPLAFFEGSFQTPALFLDRDDVVVKNVPYNGDPAKVELMKGAVELIQAAHQRGFWVVLVTNQSGLGRDRIDWQQYQRVHQQMLQLLAQEGCWIDECLWASYIDGANTPEGYRMASLRKPRNGMFQLARQKLRMNLAESIMVGDSASDLIAAADSGISHLYLYGSDKSASEVLKLQAYQRDNEGFKFVKIARFQEIVF